MNQYTILNDKEVIEIKGENRIEFLQSLITNDLTPNNPLIYSLMLTPQGRFLYDLFIYKTAESFLIEIHSLLKNSFLNRLKLYNLRSKIEIIDKSQELRVTYSQEPIQSANFSCKDPRFNKLGFRSIVTCEELARIDSTVKPELYLDDKYHYTVLDGLTDLIQEKSLPPEYGMEFLNAISYTKGCYVGQEVISRAKYQGVVRKKIFKITAEENLSHITQGTELQSQEQKIGIVTSCYGNKGIALIKIDEFEKLSGNKIKVNDISLQLSVAEWYK